MFVRYASAVTSGTFVTLALFYLMQSLISLQPDVIVEPLPRGTLTFRRLIEDRPVEKKPLQQQFEELKEAVRSTPERETVQSGLDGLGVRVTAVANPPTAGIDSLNSIMTDGPLVAIVRVRPVFPPRAATLGLEGFVIVQFDIETDGTVSNVTIVESTHRIFERAAINAAKRFRFKARVVDGVPQPSHAVQNLFRFVLEHG